MKRVSVRRLYPEFVGVIKEGGVDIPLVLNGTVVGAVQWDLEAAVSAIVAANTTPQDDLRERLGANDGRPEASNLAAVLVAATVGVELRLLARLAFENATMAASAARSLFKQCVGCHRYFVPIWDRKKPAGKGGPQSLFCSESCQKKRPRRTRTPEQKAAADRDRRDRQAAERFGTTPALLKAARINANLLKELARQVEPERRRGLTLHLRSRKYAKRAHKPSSK